MLYNLAEWAKEQLPEWLEQSIVERSMPAAAAPVDPVAPSAKEVHFAFGNSQLKVQMPVVLVDSCCGYLLLRSIHHQCSRAFR